MKELDLLIQEMTIEEKAALLSGTKFWETNPIPRVGIPAMYMTDGPCGLRKQGENTDHLGINKSEETTCFPTGVTVAASWNTNNARKMGEAIAKEAQHFGVNMVLGPAVNINKNPRCGRSFEYYSEDPYLSGKMGVAFVKGVQSQGVGTSVKHFAVNNNENYRFMGDSVLDERTMREIYLKAFEMIVKESKPTTVMSAYNKINGTYCSENKKLLTDILRQEWGFDGAVISDWGGVSNRVAGVMAGLDLEMPGDCDHFRARIIEAVKNGILSMKDLNQAVRRILLLIKRTQNDKKGQGFNKELHHNLSESIAIDGAVLLRNEGILPLKADQNYLIIGDLFEKMRYQGAGSSLINPVILTTPKGAFDNRGLQYEFVRGYRESGIEAELTYENEAMERAKHYDTILFFGGQTDYTESEGYDREHLKLPSNQLSLLKKLRSLNKKIIFVMYGGSPVELPFHDEMMAILNMYLPGQAGGEATAKLLFGEVSPSGKLPETWMNSYDDVLFGENYISSDIELYKESIYVGYRYYDQLKGMGVRYPFGHGLSYTQFTYKNLKLKDDKDIITATCDIKNTGTYAGAEVVQLYVKNAPSDVFKAEKELRAFTKVYLQPGETKQVSLTFNKADLAYYHVGQQQWVLENGLYHVLVAASATDIRIQETLKIEGEAKVQSPYDQALLPTYYNPSQLSKLEDEEFKCLIGREIPKSTRCVKTLTMESKLDDFKTSNFIGKQFYNAVVGVGQKQVNRALKLPEGSEREMELKSGMFVMKLMPNNSINAMMAASSGKFPYHIARGIIDMASGRYLKGLKWMASKEKVAPLPKELNVTMNEEAKDYVKNIFSKN